MFDADKVQKAVRKAIETEKNAMNFYELGARLMRDPDAKRVFELLAGEERVHAGHFFKAYDGSDIDSFDDFMNTPPEDESDWLRSMARTIDEGFTEQKALELALDKEEKLEKTLRATAERIADPDVRAVFELNARETHNHYEVIESEYARVMAMVHESDMDTYVRE
ncbi:MAG TPA: ferritin family protein [Geobacteraceae bacterium]